MRQVRRVEGRGRGHRGQLRNEGYRGFPRRLPSEKQGQLWGAPCSQFVEPSDGERCGCLAGGLPDMHLAWRPEAGSGPAEELAVGVGSHVVVFNVDPSVTEDKMDIDLSSDSPGGGWTAHCGP